MKLLYADEICSCDAVLPLRVVYAAIHVAVTIGCWLGLQRCV